MALLGIVGGIFGTRKNKQRESLIAREQLLSNAPILDAILQKSSAVERAAREIDDMHESAVDRINRGVRPPGRQSKL